MEPALWRIALQWKRAPKIGATVAVAADPGLLPLPSSEDGVEPSPDEEAELLASRTVVGLGHGCARGCLRCSSGLRTIAASVFVAMV